MRDVVGILFQKRGLQSGRKRPISLFMTNWLFFLISSKIGKRISSQDNCYPQQEREQMGKDTNFWVKLNEGIINPTL